MHQKEYPTKESMLLSYLGTKEEYTKLLLRDNFVDTKEEGEREYERMAEKLSLRWDEHVEKNGNIPYPCECPFCSGSLIDPRQ